MKKRILLLKIGLLFSTPILAKADCFLVKENNKTIKQEGECKTRHTPFSTFKIPLSLMGYNEGIFIDENYPEWEFEEGYVDFRESWKQPHTPELWIKNSCAWYSQVLTQKLGINKFRDYVRKFNYGNQDISGGEDNGLTDSWLSSDSLKISPGEQSIFLQRLLDNKLPVSLKAHRMTRNILFIEDLVDGWKLYGKTGGGPLLNHEIGWFIGWIQKEDRAIVFVNYIQDEEKRDTHPCVQAKATAKVKLAGLIETMRK